MSDSQKCIIQFVWPNDDEGDYLCYREMTPEQVAEVSALLGQAEAKGRIRSEWYVGPLGESSDPYKEYIEELRDDLDLACRCIPTLNEPHPDCPFHGFEEK
jgi:hypothetical protein